jgi:hypothetical protein
MCPDEEEENLKSPEVAQTYCDTCMLNLEIPTAGHPGDEDLINMDGDISQEEIDGVKLLWTRHGEFLRRLADGDDPLRLNPRFVHAFPPTIHGIRDMYAWLHKLNGVLGRMSRVIFDLWANEDAANPTDDDISLFLRIRLVVRRTYIRINEEVVIEDQELMEQALLCRIQALFSPVPLESLQIDQLDCDICYNRLGEDIINEDGLTPAENPIRLPCGHVFGQVCIKQFLQAVGNPKCPLCRHSLDLSQPPAALPWWQAGLSQSEESLPLWLRMLMGESYEKPYEDEVDDDDDDDDDSYYLYEDNQTVS